MDTTITTIYEKLEPLIDKHKITPKSRIVCSWDDAGQWVNIAYAFDGKTKTMLDFTLLYAVTYNSCVPSETSWKIARYIAAICAKRLQIPLTVLRYDFAPTT